MDPGHLLFQVQTQRIYAGRELSAPHCPGLSALTALKCKGSSFKAWAGVRTEGEISLFTDGKFCKSEHGELQLTEYGISGIPVFQLSTYAVRAVREGHKAELRINFMPELSEEELKKLLYARKKACPYKKEKELLVGLSRKSLSKSLYHKNNWFLP